MGYVDSVSESVQNSLKEISDSSLRECFYTSTKDDIDIENIESNKRICVKINLAEVSNYYHTLSEFLNANKIDLKHSTFYIHEIDYLENKSQKNNSVENYKSNIEIIKFLQTIADYNRPVAGDLELFFYKAEQGVAFTIDYTWEQIPDDLSKVSGKIKDLYSQFTQLPDSKERKQIFINDLISILSKKGNSYLILLDNIKVLIENYQKSFDLYLSGFSFEKIKTASIEYFHELTDRIHSTILKYSTYIFAIPVAYIFLIRFLDFSGKSILKDSFLILLGTVFFVLIWFVLFKSVHGAISSVEKDITSFKDKLGNDKKFDSIKNELNNQQNNIIPKQKKRLLLVKILTILILASSIVAYTFIHYHYFKSIIDKPKTEELDKNNNDKNENQTESDTLKSNVLDSTVVKVKNEIK